MKFIKQSLTKLRLFLIGDALSDFRELGRWQWLNKDQISTLQQQMLKKLLLHAYGHVPYYTEIMRDLGIVNASRAVNLKLFDKIPLLNKAIIRARFEDLKSDDLSIRKWRKNSSGGSTGEPVIFIQDYTYADWTTAIKILYDSWTGCSIADKRVCLWGSERDIFLGKETNKARLILWLSNNVILNAFYMTPKDMLDFVNKINFLKPVQILSYVESIYELSKFIEREEIRIHSPRAIMTSAGPLSSHVRETVEGVFHAPVFNRYGSREVGDIACECEHHSGLHVCAPTHFVEILKADGSVAEPGETGEIVITCLNNYAMPLIRYRIGDMGIWSDQPCKCGRNWPLLKEVVGRVTDIFLKSDGSQIHGEYFTHLFYFQDWVKKFQVIQEDIYTILVKIVPIKKYDNYGEKYAQEIKMITEKILLLMGQESHVNFDFVDDIPPSASGKYRYTISKIKRKERMERSQ